LRRRKVRSVVGLRYSVLQRAGRHGVAGEGQQVGDSAIDSVEVVERRQGKRLVLFVRCGRFKLESQRFAFSPQHHGRSTKPPGMLVGARVA
jgi:hypothetical protein